MIVEDVHRERAGQGQLAFAGRGGVLAVAVRVRIREPGLGLALLLDAVRRPGAGRLEVRESVGAAGLGMLLRVVELGVVARDVDEVGLAVLEPVDVRAAAAVLIDDAVAGGQAVAGAEVDRLGARVDDIRGARVEYHRGAVLGAARRGLGQHVELVVGRRRQHERGGVVHHRRAGDRRLGVGNDHAEAEGDAGAALRAVRDRLGVDRVARREVQLGRGIDRGAAVHLGEGVGADGVGRHGGVRGGIGRAGVARQLVPRAHRRARAEGDAAARAG